MKYYNITINGKLYQVSAEEVTASDMSLSGLKEEVAATSVPSSFTAVPKENAEEKISSQKDNVDVSKKNTRGVLKAPMPGTISNIMIKEGQQVNEGQVILVLEAMKMENEIFAHCKGIVTKIYVNKGDSVNSGDMLFLIE